MQQVLNKSAAALLCVLLALVFGCGGGSSSGGGGVAYYPDPIPVYYPDPVYPGTPIRPPDRHTSDLKATTEFVDEITWRTNRRLASGELFENECLIELDFEGNKVSPLEYNFSYGNVIKYTANGTPRTRLYSTVDKVSFVVFNFNDLLPSQFISYVEVIGDADFSSWQREGFALGMRHGGSDQFLWTGPVGGNHNWIFTYSLHEAQNYGGGVPSIAIAVSNGDVMRISKLKIVVSDVNNHLVRAGEGDPHFSWPYPVNEFYNSHKDAHFYNGSYHSLTNDFDPWRDPYQPVWKDPYQPVRKVYRNRAHPDDYYWDEYNRQREDDLWNQINGLQDEVDDLNDLIEEITPPEPVDPPAPIIAPPGPAPSPAPAPATQPVIKAAPVL